MKSVHVTSSDAPRFPRRRLERAIEHNSAAPFTPPICKSPTYKIVVDPDGRCHACPHSSSAVGTLADTGLKAVFNGEAMRRLRETHAADALSSEHCTPCIAAFGRDRDALAPLAREEANTRADGAVGLRVIHWRLDSPLPPTKLAAKVLAVAGDVDEIVIDMVQSPTTDFGVIERLCRNSGTVGPQIALRVRSLPDKALESLRNCRLTRIELVLSGVSSDFQHTLEAAHQIAKAHAVDLTVRFVLTPDSWFELLPVALATAAVQGKLLLRLALDADSPTLGDLRLAELKLLYQLLSEWWSLLTSPERPASLSAHEFTALMAELRGLTRDIAEAHAWSTPQRALNGRRAAFRLPPPEHSTFADETRTSGLLRTLAWADKSPSLLAWVRELATRSNGESILAANTWLRILFLKVATETPDSDVYSVLRKVYLPPQERRTHREMDIRDASAAGLGDLVTSLHNRLGLHSMPDRRPPFQSDESPRHATAAGVARVTVLVPSFHHQRYVVTTLRSVLAQTTPDFEILVVDDHSADETVARALQVDDPRVRIAVNTRNIGLGNTVLGALSSVTTPYVALLNSDDTFHPERLERCLQILEGSEDIRVVATGYCLIDDQGNRLVKDNVSQLLDGPLIAGLVQWFERSQPADVEPGQMFDLLLRGNFLATSSNLVCRTDFLRACNESLASLKYCLDWQIFLAAASRRALHYLPTPLLGYRLHATNTVWFQKTDRWQYNLEVSRVAAQSVRDHIAQLTDRTKALDALSLAIATLRHNREIRAFALVIHAFTSPDEAMRIQDQPPTVLARVQELVGDAANAGAQGTPVPAEAEQDTQEDLWRLPQLRILAILQDVYRGDCTEATHAHRSALDQLDDLEGRLAQALLTHRTLHEQHAAERATLHDTLRELGASTTRFQVMQARVSTMEGDLQELRQKLEGSLSVVRDHEHRIAQLLEDKDSAAREHEQQVTRLLEANASALRAATESRDMATARQQELEALLHKTRADSEEKLTTLRATREWRYGNFFWNKLPLTASSARRLKKLYNGVRNLGAHTGRLVRGALDWRPHRSGTAIVAATGRFPHYSHTFVYQEIVALRDMGLDPTLFYWIREDTDILAPAYHYLLEHSTCLASSWDIHTANFEWWQQKAPERVDELARRVAEAAGMSVEKLQWQFEWRQAFTFARAAYAQKPDYFHSYFFYEQSLFTLVAAHLLDVPRGVSAYADHMLSDWPLKVVPLHIETADIVVATSHRIKRELVALGGQQFADKIIVKPNGVDGRVFTMQQRSESPPECFDVLSVSRIEPKKGLLTLVEAAKLLKDAGKLVRFRIVGAADKEMEASKSYDLKLRERIGELDVGDRVILEGLRRQQELLPIQATCHAFVAPYVETPGGDKDGIPTALLEAMATGLPALVTDAGSITEVVRHGIEGYIFPQHDAVALAAAVTELLSDPRRRLRMGQDARRRFDAEFATEVTEARLHARIRTALRERAKTKPKS